MKRQNRPSDLSHHGITPPAAGIARHRWAVVLAGGDGTRLQDLTRHIAGDLRPKQFCRICGEKTLLNQTRDRLRPLFGVDRTLFVVTRGHERFYEEDLFDPESSRTLVQPLNRGTGIAIALALLQVRQSDPDATIAFFPSDHFYADDAAFVAATEAGIRAAEIYRRSVILLGAEPGYPEVEYGWIEPGPSISAAGSHSLFTVSRFWEKPPIRKARELMSTGCFWNTFIAVGRVDAFLYLLRSVIPTTVEALAEAQARDAGEDAYNDLKAVDFSRDVLTLQPHRLLVLPDAASGWADLGTPRRVLDTLLQNRIEPDWLRKSNRFDPQFTHQREVEAA